MDGLCARTCMRRIVLWCVMAYGLARHGMTMGILVRCHKTKPLGEEFGKNWIKGSPDIQQDNYQTLGSSSCKAGLS